MKDTWLDRFAWSNSHVVMKIGAWSGGFDVPAVMQRITEKGVLCGSRVYAGASQDSDYDYIVRHADFPELDVKHLKNYNQAGSMPSLGWKFAYKHGGHVIVINLIVCTDPLEWDSWMQAHNKMVELMQIPQLRDLCGDKRVRVAVFTTLRESVGLMDRKPGEPWPYTPGDECPF